MWVHPTRHKKAGRAFAAMRKRAGITQQELARRLHKPQSFVSAYEKGQRRVDLPEFLLIVDAIEIDPRRAFAAILETQQ